MKTHERHDWQGITCHDAASYQQVKPVSWKKRMAVTLAATLAVGMLAGWVATQQVTTPPAVYTVQAGDTLWSIAERFATEDVDLREAYWQIMQDNGLNTDGVIQPGQQLVIYRY